MLTAIGPWRLKSSGAHCDPELGKRISEEEDEKKEKKEEKEEKEEEKQS